MDQVVKLDIKAITDYLALLGIVVERGEDTNGLVHYQLAVPLGVDAQGNERLVLLAWEDSKLIAENVDGAGDISLMKFIGMVSLEVIPEAVSDTARLISFLNHMIELPGFVYSETLRNVHFVYALPVVDLSIQGKQLVSVIGLIGSMLDLYQEMIQEVASGGTSFDKLLTMNGTDEEPD